MCVSTRFHLQCRPVIDVITLFWILLKCLNEQRYTVCNKHKCIHGKEYKSNITQYKNTLSIFWIFHHQNKWYYTNIKKQSQQNIMKLNDSNKLEWTLDHETSFPIMQTQVFWLWQIISDAVQFNPATQHWIHFVHPPNTPNTIFHWKCGIMEAKITSH